MGQGLSGRAEDGGRHGGLGLWREHEGQLSLAAEQFRGSAWLPWGSGTLPPCSPLRSARAAGSRARPRERWWGTGLVGAIGHICPNDIPCCQGAAAHPDSEEQQQRLREAAEGLRMATNAAAQNAIKKKLVHKLEVSRLGWAGTAAWGIAGAANGRRALQGKGQGQADLGQVPRTLPLPQSHEPRSQCTPLSPFPSPCPPLPRTAVASWVRIVLP